MSVQLNIKSGTAFAIQDLREAPPQSKAVRDVERMENILLGLQDYIKKARPYTPIITREFKNFILDFTVER